MKNINITNLPDDVYFNLLKLKANLKAETWNEFAEILSKAKEVKL
jgi:predicted CopG family antitoxin